MKENTHLVQTDGKTETSAQELLNELLAIAQFSESSVEDLKRDDWESIYTFRPFELNGAANGGDLAVALEKIKATVAVSTGDWELCLAREQKDLEDEALRREGIYHILKKKTQQRLDWEERN